MSVAISTTPTTTPLTSTEATEITEKIQWLFSNYPTEDKEDVFIEADFSGVFFANNMKGYDPAYLLSRMAHAFLGHLENLHLPH